MLGKILKISSNDLYGNVDERKIIVFACFNHIKYMNKYLIFTFEGEFNKKKLYFGSLHLKENSLVVFSVNKQSQKYIEDFTNNYLSSIINPEEYQLIDISHIEKIELVSYNEIASENLEKLYNLSIPKKNIHPEETIKKKPTILYILLVILIILAIGLTYLYLKPNDFKVELKKLTCQTEEYHEELSMPYEVIKEIKFDKSEKIKKINTTEIYKFTSLDNYQKFKDNNQQNEYFNIDGTYKYDDNNQQFKVIYEETTIIDNYKEIYEYLKDEGYNCQEGKYYE